VPFFSAQGDYLASKWAQLTHLSLESVTINAPVQGLTLTLIRHGEPQAAYHDLFDGNTGTLASLDLLSLLQAKLGQGAIHSPLIHQDPRPEKANQYSLPDLTTQSQSRESPAISAAPLPSQKRLRPSILLPTPEPLNTPITLSQGPERIVSGWWDGEKVIRDYFIARCETGRWLWVFRTPNKAWFVHGLFS
jgi:protein ImuB